MKFVEFKEEIQKAYAKQFPNSMCNVIIFKGLGRMIAIDCYLAGDKSEFKYGYALNDMFDVGMIIHMPNGFEKEDDLPENLEMNWQHSCIKAKPESKYLAYGAERVAYRKAKGDAHGIIRACNKYFKRLHDAVEKMKQEDRIHPDFVELVNQKVR